MRLSSPMGIFSIRDVSSPVVAINIETILQLDVFISVRLVILLIIQPGLVSWNVPMEPMPRPLIAPVRFTVRPTTTLIIPPDTVSHFATKQTISTATTLPGPVCLNAPRHPIITQTTTLACVQRDARVVYIPIHLRGHACLL